MVLTSESLSIHPTNKILMRIETKLPSSSGRLSYCKRGKVSYELHLPVTLGAKGCES